MTDPPEQTRSQEYNRGWSDGHTSALDACQPLIDHLQEAAEFANRADAKLRTIHGRLGDRDWACVDDANAVLSIVEEALAGGET